MGARRGKGVLWTAMSRVYLDHAATTPVDPRVVEAMKPYWTEAFGNPSSLHAEGRRALQALDEARNQVAAVLGADPEEIVFTAGGSEADNLAISGVLGAAGSRKYHVVTSAVEHHAVLYTCQFWLRQGYEVTVLPVDEYGQVRPADLAAALRPDTALVSIMMANNEVGTLQPVAELAALCRERGVLFHTDAVQAVGAVPVHVRELGVDLLSLSAHKFYGPKGAGALYVRKGVRLQPLIHGGGQERTRRAGTENIPGIVGLAAALRLAQAEMTERTAHIRSLRRRLEEGLLRLPGTRLNGHPERRLPGHVNVSFAGVESEPLLVNLDLAGIAASGGSACTSGSLEPSHVLKAMGVPGEWIRGSVRFSLGRENTEADVDRVLSVLPGILERLRAISAQGAQSRQ